MVLSREETAVRQELRGYYNNEKQERVAALIRVRAMVLKRSRQTYMIQVV